MPLLLSRWGKEDGAPSARSLAYVLGNMLSAGGMLLLTACLRHRERQATRAPLLPSESGGAPALYTPRRPRAFTHG